MAVWGNLSNALRTGKRQNIDPSIGEITLWEQIYATETSTRGFLSAMSGVSMGVAMIMTQKFDWKKFNTFVDIGCAQGCLPGALGITHPHLRGIGYDLAPVKPIFEEYISSLNLSDRVTFQTGSFMEDSSLPSADVLVMGHILHDYDLETKKMLIKKAYNSLPQVGTILVWYIVL